MPDARCRVGGRSRIDVCAWPVRGVVWVSHWVAYSAYQPDDFRSQSRCAAGLDLCHALVRHVVFPFGSGWGKLGGDKVSPGGEGAGGM